MTEEKGKKPTFTFRAGAVSGSVWENITEKGKEKIVSHSVSLQRGYKDSEGNWKNTQSLFLNDIPKARLVLAECYEWILVNQYADKKEGK